MNKQKIETTIKELASKEFKIPAESISLKSSLISDLRVDSLSIVELIMAVEEKFSIHFPDPTHEKLSTLQDIIDHASMLVTNSKN